MFIRPAAIPEGVESAGDRYRVRDPITHQFLADEGEHKPGTDYWLRRLLDGGVEEAEPPAEAESELGADQASQAHVPDETLLIEHEGGVS